MPPPPLPLPFAFLLAALAACGGGRPEERQDQDGAGEPAAHARPPVAVSDSASLQVAAARPGAEPALADTALAGAARRPAPRSAARGTAAVPAPPPSAAADSARPAAAPAARPTPAGAPAAPPEPPAGASAPPPTTPAPAPAVEARRPFRVGERLSYEVRFGPVRVGTATMEVRGVEEVRGQRAYHAVFDVRGGNRLYAVNDHYESWFTVAGPFASLRYAQQIDQGTYERERRFEIFPDRDVFREAGKPEEPSVDEPLDDASFLYFLRTVPLEVGRTYTYDRYFRPDRNPVTVRVLRRERVKVPAGEFDAIVVQPVIKTKGIFSEGGRAEVWFAADSTRRILQIRSRLKFGSLSLHLR